MNALRKMEDEELKSADLKRLCQAVSPNDEPCDNPAKVRCTSVGGFAMLTPRMRSGIPVRCRQEKKAANRRLRLSS